MSRSASTSRLRDVPTFTALVDCLCNFLDEHTEETSTTVSPIFPKTRPLGERKALTTLSLMLAENVPAALDAGIVSRWLAKYPFPCALQDESKRRNIVKLMKTWWTDDSTMSTIVGTLANNQEGVKQLRKYGLMGSRMEEHTHDYHEYDLFYGNGTIYDEFDDSENSSDSDSYVWERDEVSAPSSGRRPQEGSVEDQALRRRRREAMVFSEGGRPVGREDIISPVLNDRDEDEDLERELDQLMDQVNEEIEGEAVQQETAVENQQPPSRWQWQIWPFSSSSS